LDYRYLGNTGLKVSRICFGTLTLGPLQAGLSLEEGAGLLVEAYRCGINFWDTAELYDNYPYLALALKDIRDLPVITTKTYAYTREGAAASLEKARRELNLDVIPIFLLHEQESALTLKGHRPALDYLIEAKQKGLVKAVGISTHHVAAVKAATELGCIDVIHPLINYKGVGIRDGTPGEMLAAIEAAFDRGIGIYGMKVLGGGHLLNTIEEAFSFARNLSCLHSFAVGMSSSEELRANLHYIQGTKPPEDILAGLAGKKRRLKIEDWCIGCGTCVSKCPQGALSLQEINSSLRAVVDPLLCIFCGYCGAYCSEFCLKIY
jgi:predicted aldo/keto reductase-like oxidoreductase